MKLGNFELGFGTAQMCESVLGRVGDIPGREHGVCRAGEKAEGWQTD